MAILPPRFSSSGAGWSALHCPARVALCACHRPGNMVELQHDFAQFRAQAVFSIGWNQSFIFCRFECSPGDPADSMARSSYGTSCERGVALARFPATPNGDSAGLGALGNPGLVTTAFL